MKIHIDIRDGITPSTAMYCVSRVIDNGRVSKDGKLFCYLTTFDTSTDGKIYVATRDYRKSDCFVVYKPKTDED